MLRHLTTPPRDGQRSSPTLQRTQSSASTQSPPTLGRRLSTSRGDLVKKMSPMKVKVSPQLRQALRLLCLRDIDDFQSNFLRTDAFLQPWVEFRDGFLLVQPKDMPRVSSPGQVTRRDIIHYYTYYEEGKLRYDPRADPKRNEYDPDTSLHNVIDKSHWGVADHEKLLYVWLLQNFKVGKKQNPYGFEYFQSLNICTAWEKVVLPIVEAVRNDYNPKGRKYYGPFAKYIEDIAPSRLAFPEGSVPVNQQFDMGDAPKAIAPKNVAPKQLDNPVKNGGGTIHPVTGWLMPKKEARDDDDDDDKELRDVFSQYGQVVERPKPKKPLMEWIRDQKLKKEREKALKALEAGPQAVHRESAQHREDLSEVRLRVAREVERKRTSTSPQTFQIHQRDIPGYANLARSPTNSSRLSRRESANALYNAIRNSNPFMNLEDPRIKYGHPSDRSSPPATNALDRSAVDATEEKYSTVEGFANLSMDAPGQMQVSSVEQESSPLQRFANLPVDNNYSPHERAATVSVELKPSPLEKAVGGYHGVEPGSSPPMDLRKPSYEGTAYGSPSLPSLKEAKPTERVRATRIPSPIQIPSNEIARKYHPIVGKAIERDETTSSTMGSSPPIPPKNPMRYTSPHGHVRATHSAASGAAESGHHVPRIVSKENIRAALTMNDSDESLELQRSSPGDRSAFAGIGGRGMNTGESPKVQTYNTHMFPRGRSTTPVRQGKMDPSIGHYELDVIGEKDTIDE